MPIKKNRLKKWWLKNLCFDLFSKKQLLTPKGTHGAETLWTRIPKRSGAAQSSDKSVHPSFFAKLKWCHSFYFLTCFTPERTFVPNFWIFPVLLASQFAEFRCYYWIVSERGEGKHIFCIFLIFVAFLHFCFFRGNAIFPSRVFKFRIFWNLVCFRLFFFGVFKMIKMAMYLSQMQVEPEWNTFISTVGVFPHFFQMF